MRLLEAHEHSNTEEATAIEVKVHLMKVNLRIIVPLFIKKFPIYYIYNWKRKLQVLFYSESFNSSGLVGFMFMCRKTRVAIFLNVGAATVPP